MICAWDLCLEMHLFVARRQFADIDLKCIRNSDNFVKIDTAASGLDGADISHGHLRQSRQFSPSHPPFKSSFLNEFAHMKHDYRLRHHYELLL